MPAPLNPNLWPTVLHDVDAIPIGTASNPIFVTGGGTPTNQPTFATNQKTVPVPGTAQQLQAQPVPNGFTIFVAALDNNKGNVYVGKSAVDAQTHTKANILTAGAFRTLALTDVSAIFIDADNAGEGVQWIVETP